VDNGGNNRNDAQPVDLRTSMKNSNELSLTLTQTLATNKYATLIPLCFRISQPFTFSRHLKPDTAKRPVPGTFLMTNS